MASTKTYDFSSSEDYNYDTSKVKIVDGLGSLLLIDYPNQSYINDFSDNTGWTYDSNLIEWTGTEVAQKNQYPDATYGNNFTTKDANWSDGSAIGTLQGGAVVDLGMLDLTGGTGKHMDVVATGMINPVRGTIKGIFNTNFAGNPVGDIQIFSFSNTKNANPNKLTLKYDKNKAFRFDYYNAVGVGVSNIPLGSATFTLGQRVEFSFNYDFTTGSEVQNLYIDGAQQGGTQNRVSLRSDDLTTVTHIEFGSQIYADNYLDDIIIYSEVQNTAPYTPGYTIGDYRYLESRADSPQITSEGSPDGYLKSVEGFTVTGCGMPQWTFNDEAGNYYYWNSTLSPAAWDLSDGSYAQSSSAQDILDHIDDFPATGRTTVFAYSVVFPNNANIHGCADNLDVTYTSQIYTTDVQAISPINAERFFSEGMFTFESTEVIVGSDSITYIMVSDGAKYYHDGADWTLSNNTVAQSNTAAEVSANITTFVTGKEEVGFDVLLFSNDGLTTPKIDESVFTYDLALGPPSNLPRIVDINGYIYDNNAPVEGLQLRIRPYYAGFINPGDGLTGGAFNMYTWKNLGITVTDGYFSGSAYLQPSGKFWEIEVGTQTYRTQLIDKDSNDLSELSLQLVED